MTSRHLGPDPARLTEAQQRAWDAIASGPRGTVIGPLRVWVTNPAMAEKAQALGQYARFDSSLPPILSELAILVTGRYWSAGFEWAQHAPIALAAGLDPAIIDAIGQGRRPVFHDAAQQLVFDFAVELHRDKRVSDDTYERTVAALGIGTAVDIVAICGYYTLISMTINAFGIPDGEGAVLPSIDLAPAQMFRD
jgi:4-carboxymuconolactone decarboxylase